LVPYKDQTDYDLRERILELVNELELPPAHIDEPSDGLKPI
jgi:hypothetical protein